MAKRPATQEIALREPHTGDYLAALMRFSIRGASIAVSVMALSFFCSCEKHHVGEYPEVQKEQTGTEQAAAKPASENAAGVHPTPADFFPPKKSP